MQCCHYVCSKGNDRSVYVEIDAQESATAERACAFVRECIQACVLACMYPVARADGIVLKVQANQMI